MDRTQMVSSPNVTTDMCRRPVNRRNGVRNKREAAEKNELTPFFLAARIRRKTVRDTRQPFGRPALALRPEQKKGSGVFSHLLA